MPERALFPGVMILLLAAVALVPPLRRDARGLRRCALVVAFEMSRGFNSAFYPYLYDVAGICPRPARAGARQRPRRDDAGAASRLSACGGCWPDGRGGCSRQRWRHWSSRSASTCGRCCGSSRSGSSRRRSTASSPATRTSSSPSFPSAAIRARFTPNAPFMYFSLWHWAQMLNGYSGHYPPDRSTSRWRCGSFPERGRDRAAAARGARRTSPSTARSIADGCDELLAAVDALPAFRVVASGSGRARRCDSTRSKR